jgi:hypothetical protein
LAETAEDRLDSPSRIDCNRLELIRNQVLTMEKAGCAGWVGGRDISSSKMPEARYSARACSGGDVSGPANPKILRSLFHSSFLAPCGFRYSTGVKCGKMMACGRKCESFPAGGRLRYEAPPRLASPFRPLLLRDRWKLRSVSGCFSKKCARSDSTSTVAGLK